MNFKKLAVLMITIMTMIGCTFAPSAIMTVSAEETAPADTAATETAAPAPLPPLAAPRLRVRYRTGRTITLQWTAPATAEGYYVYFGKYGQKMRKIATTARTTYKVGSLNEITSYKFRVFAYRHQNGRIVKTGSSFISGRTSYCRGRTRLMNLAKSKLGCRYVSGAAGPNRFDCSGYVYYCYKTARASSRSFSRTSAQGIYNNLRRYNIGTNMRSAKPGDIVLCGSSRSRISHAAMVYSSTNIINAANPRKGVCVLKSRYFHVVAILRMPFRD